MLKRLSVGAAYLTPHPSLSVAVSEVSGGAAALATGRLLVLACRRLGEPQSGHQREARRPVFDRHSESQETAIRTSSAMTLTSEHCTPPPPDPNNTRLCCHGNQ